MGGDWNRGNAWRVGDVAVVNGIAEYGIMIKSWEVKNWFHYSLLGRGQMLLDYIAHAKCFLACSGVCYKEATSSKLAGFLSESSVYLESWIYYWAFICLNPPGCFLWLDQRAIHLYHLVKLWMYPAVAFLWLVVTTDKPCELDCLVNIMIRILRYSYIMNFIYVAENSQIKFFFSAKVICMGYKKYIVNRHLSLVCFSI